MLIILSGDDLGCLALAQLPMLDGASVPSLPTQLGTHPPRFGILWMRVGEEEITWCGITKKIFSKQAGIWDYARVF